MKKIILSLTLICFIFSYCSESISTKAIVEQDVKNITLPEERKIIVWPLLSNIYDKSESFTRYNKIIKQTIKDLNYEVIAADSLLTREEIEKVNSAYNYKGFITEGSLSEYSRKLNLPVLFLSFEGYKIYHDYLLRPDDMAGNITQGFIGGAIVTGVVILVVAAVFTGKGSGSDLKGLGSIFEIGKVSGSTTPSTIKTISIRACLLDPVKNKVMYNQAFKGIGIHYGSTNYRYEPYPEPAKTENVFKETVKKLLGGFLL